jgi:hypothetical protein
LVSEILGIFAPTIFSLLQYKRKAPANESFPDQLGVCSFLPAYYSEPKAGFRVLGFLEASGDVLSINKPPPLSASFASGL